MFFLYFRLSEEDFLYVVVHWHQQRTSPAGDATSIVVCTHVCACVVSGCAIVFRVCLKTTSLYFARHYAGVMGFNHAKRDEVVQCTAAPRRVSLACSTTTASRNAPRTMVCQ